MPASKQPKLDRLSIQDFHGGSALDEQRRENRTPMQRPISVLRCDRLHDEGFVSAQLVDCSRRGIGFIHSKEMRIGERFLVKVQLQKILLAVYTTRFCRAEGSGFQIGAELSGFVGGANDNPDEVFKAFINSGDQNNSGESVGGS